MPTTPTQLPCYRLADHVRACRIDHEVVLLDLQRDKYLGIGREQQQALSQAIVDWPATEARHETLSPRVALDNLLKPLIDQKMLAEAGASRQPIEVLAAPNRSLDPARPGRSSSASLGLLALLCSASITGIWLKRRNLASIADSVRHLKPRLGACPSLADTNELRIAVSSYMRLRPFLFTAHDKCLHDSLTLVRFLAWRGLHPSWVIGVRTQPFAAHSWVQAGDLVLNDVHENVRRYTPILIV